MDQDILFHVKSLSRFIYFVTEEEDTFLLKLRKTLEKVEDSVYVFNGGFGLVRIGDLINDWKTHAHATSQTVQFHDAMTEVYKQNARGRKLFYVITDPERWLTEAGAVRRILNIAHQVHNDETAIKVLIFVGHSLFLPAKLQRYFEVVHDKGLSAEEIEATVHKTCALMNQPPVPEAAKLFKGLTSYEIDSAITQSLVWTKNDSKNPRRVDPAFIRDYKKRELLKTQLVQYIDTNTNTFANVGGVQRFKEWASKIKHTWTKEGQAFGLKPPRGVLCVGVWGCGKSLSVKALGNAWNLPVLQLEMGRLRGSGVGDTESNTYRALRLIDSLAPVLIWVDEAEKSLSGGQSSNFSDAGTTSRMLGIFSTWIQETKAQVCLAMTANTLSTMPVEMVNRMDERFYFDLPSEDERLEILKIHLRLVNQDPRNYNLAELALKSDKLVGREIEQAVGAAMVESFCQGKSCLDEGILANELVRKPRIINTMKDEVKALTDWVGFDPVSQDGIRARLASPKRGASFTVIGGDDS